MTALLIAAAFFVGTGFGFFICALLVAGSDRRDRR